MPPPLARAADAGLRPPRNSPATLASGAGRDAALFANSGVPSGMLILGNGSSSHNPHEAIGIADFMKGVGMLAETIRSF